jgi:hypothetical protein
VNLKVLSALALAGACALDGAAWGQTATSQTVSASPAQHVSGDAPAPVQPVVSPDMQTAVASTCCKVAALTPIELEILTPASSKTSTQGQQIRIRTIERISVGGTVVIPEGTEGFAEVIQVSHGAFGGKAGELVIGAPYLMLGNQRIGLKRFGYGRTSGRDETGAATIATAFIGLPGMLIGGGNIDIAGGTRAHAVVTTETFIPVQPPVISSKE